MPEAPYSPEISIPVPKAIDAIRKRLEGDIEYRHLMGITPTAAERLQRDAEGLATKTVRGDILLDPSVPEDAKILDEVSINSRKLKAWLDSRGLRDFMNEVYTLDTDASPNLPPSEHTADDRIVELMASHPDFDASYRLFRDRTFQLDIDFVNRVRNVGPQYRSGRQKLDGGMTKEEAEIILAYSEDFLSHPRRPLQLPKSA
jgi:hypothetical protein